MANLLHDRLKSFRLQPKDDKPAVMLPKAFLARTVKKCGLIPAGSEVIAEPTILGGYMLTWYDEYDRLVNQGVEADALDIDDVYALARRDLLAGISTADLHAELERRRAAEQPEVKGDE